MPANIYSRPITRCTVLFSRFHSPPASHVKLSLFPPIDSRLSQEPPRFLGVWPTAQKHDYFCLRASLDKGAELALETIRVRSKESKLQETYKHTRMLKGLIMYIEYISLVICLIVGI